MANSKHVGARFGQLTVTGVAEVRRSGRQYVQIMDTLCDCGNTRQVFMTGLTSGGTWACKTCTRPPRQHPTTHPLYSTWCGMKSRCADPGNPAHKYYGARGINVCVRWQTPRGGFDNFVNDMGTRPPGTSLDRIDTCGDYEPSNCRWADAQTQQNNKTNNVRVTLNQKTLTVAEWCRALNITPHRLAHPRKMGLSYEEIFERIQSTGAKNVKWVQTRKPRDPATYKRKAVNIDYFELHALLGVDV